MAKVLIVDDSPVDQRLAGKLLQLRSEPELAEFPTGLTPIFAANGREALESIAREKPEVVVTDLQMPVMNGLELVLEARIRFPLVPVVLMTAHGSEELAARALKEGAASYVPKRDLARDLLDTVAAVLDTAQARRGQKRLMECLKRTESRFVLGNDPSLIAPLVGHLKESLFRMCGSDETGLVQVTVALREAVQNAMEHGNLELDRARGAEDDDAYQQLAEERRRQKPYMDRRVHITATETPEGAEYVIRDEGPGFDTARLPASADVPDLDRRDGRGLFLMRTFMSEVRFNDRGNEVTLVYRPRVKVGDGMV
jgi:CheY-like chemotaxis protein